MNQVGLVGVATTRSDRGTGFEAKRVEGTLESDDSPKEPRWKADMLSESTLELSATEPEVVCEPVDRTVATARSKSRDSVVERPMRVVPRITKDDVFKRALERRKSLVRIMYRRNLLGRVTSPPRPDRLQIENLVSDTILGDPQQAMERTRSQSGTDHRDLSCRHDGDRSRHLANEQVMRLLVVHSV